MTNDIVIGVDAAWHRSGALDWALHEAVLRRMPLRAVHVVDQRVHTHVAPVKVDGQLIVPAVIPEPDSRLVDELEQYVAAADPALDLGADVLIGAPDRRMAELSAQAELTVVGRRGIGGFARLLIGSTSESVANHGHGPVVVVPDGWQRARYEHAPIVVGVDEYEQNDAALEFAFEMAALHHVPLWMVHAWDLPAPYTWDAAAISGMHDQWQQLARHRLDSVAEQWQRKHPEVHLDQQLRQSHPVPALLDTAESTGAQLIVIGGRHHRMSGLMLGSVTRGVLHHATVPVAVVHERRSIA
ncbi:nucleotide-binding universal stress UspA family protein [Kribbella orskensis]|uniref:Nucleotide-binding universal stress UspA family protein n=1 Tax=Kribbella orskensis TaxID=2512216 RepID=A0ABY2B8J2_9ACTN|nr:MULTISPECIES: universal stress protein [Kribbella]TCN31192.1 nucleotide-binding universal stress UspA family protein [Kribbella sp. VKM Ac-2500]TCO11698.1 nucleotide-binding universal stress UspA family protein [Kribbella orskensis]